MGQNALHPIAGWILGLIWLFSSWGYAQNNWSLLQNGSMVLFRHAIAPGVGDPANFKLNDCTTQRNLDEAGRNQARRLGQAFRDNRILVGRVITSQWCRTRETAQLAFGTNVQDEPAFNSFFSNRQNQEAQTQAALELLRRWQGPGVLVVVTHQVNITALTGVVPDSGEGVVVRFAGGQLQVVGRIKP